MADVVFVAIALAFFAVCVLYVQWCDIIIGPDEVSSARVDDQAAELDDVEELAA
jgi:hypothetical protein